MIRYECDRCGRWLTSNDPKRYVVKIEVYAAAAPLEFTEQEIAQTSPNAMQEVLEQLRNADPNEMEDQTYRMLKFDLCAKCQRAFLASPLGPVVDEP